MPAFDAEKPAPGFSLEAAAEEVLNGLFCHYEPPTSEDAQRKAAEQVINNPLKFGMPKRNKSILRVSRLFRKQKPHKRSVTWRDERKNDNLEGKVASCADSCDLFGKSTGGGGLSDSQAPDENVAFSSDKPQQEKKEPTTTAPLKKHDGPPKKILYDDEGNPMNEDGTELQDENVPPTSQERIRKVAPNTPDGNGLNPFFCTPFGQPPPPPPQFENDDADVYEPENYDRPPSSQSHPYRRVRSPPIPSRKPTPRHADEEDDLDETESEFLERVGKVPRSRSRSPSRRRYDDEEENVGQRSPKGMGWMKRFRRPQTPLRRRAKDDDMEYESDNDESFVDRHGRTDRRRSSSRERGRGRSPRPVPYDDDGSDDSEYYEGRGRHRSRSPGRRSEVYSELTDDYVDQPPRGRGRSKSPSRTGKSQSFMEDGIEVDYHEGRRSRSKSPSRRNYAPEADYDDAPPITTRPTKDFDDRRRSKDFEEDVDRRRSRDYGEEQQLRRPPREFDDDRRRSRDYGEEDQLRRPPRDKEEGMDRRRSKDNGEDLGRRPTKDNDADRRRSRDYDDNHRRTPREYDDRRMSTENDDRRRSREGGMQILDEDENVAPPITPRSKRRWKLGSKSRDERDLEDVTNGANREAPRSSRSKRSSMEDEEDYYDDDPRYDDRPGANRSRRVSDPIPARHRSRRHHVDTDEPDDDAYDRRRPHSTASHVSRRGPLPIDTSYDVEDNVPVSRNRDPTPRMSMEPVDEVQEVSRRHDPLPPTPRRNDRSERDGREDREGRSRRNDDDADRRQDREGRSRKYDDNADSRQHEKEGRSRGNEDTGRRPQPLNVKATNEPDMMARAHRALMRQLSPTSMATDDEIREEVSSVGMESNTIRPHSFPNPFLQVPPPVLEESPTNAESEPDPSTLSWHQPSKSTLSSSMPSGYLSQEKPESSRRRNSKKESAAAAEIVPASSSGSTKSKKLWRGWKKTMGMVKTIVQDIDEKRIPPPIFSRIQTKPSSSSSRREKKQSRE